MKKIRIPVIVGELDLLEGGCSLDKVIQHLLYLQEKHKAVEDLFIDYECVFSNDSYNPDRGYNYTLRGQRDETDAEFELRKDADKKHKLKKEFDKKVKEDADRVLYEKLKKKFEK